MAIDFSPCKKDTHAQPTPSYDINVPTNASGRCQFKAVSEIRVNGETLKKGDYFIEVKLGEVVSIKKKIQEVDSEG